jgi:hypothetical protein
MTTTAVQQGIVIRDACASDNAGLVALTSECIMEGPVALRVDRAPDFFALNRLEGDAWRVGVACRADEGVIGCVAVSGREAYVNGSARRTSYASDLKIRPAERGCGAADLLSEYAREATRELAGDSGPCLLTILSGNRRMEHRARGPRGTPRLARFASLAALAIPLLWERRTAVAGVRVRRARSADLEEMARVWSRVAPRRQLAAALDADALARWIAAAPGLTISDYLVATDCTGRISGFLGVWDQASFKQLRVVRYSPRMAVARRALNVAARLAGAPPLPPAGEPLPVLATVHACAASPTALRVLLLGAYRRHRGGRHACMTIGLDVTDPQMAAVRGFFAQPTRVDAYVTTAAGVPNADLFDGRPLHFETALV